MADMKFRIKKLLNIYGVSKHEERVRKYVKKELKKHVDSIIIDDYGNLLATKVCGDGSGANIMLNAHMDTVAMTKEDKVVVEENGVFMAYVGDKRAVLGADDRAGIAIVLEIAENVPSEFNGTLKFSFTREEEIGAIGASKINGRFYDDVDLSITFDRKGNSDIVVGTCGQAFCCNEVGNFLEAVSKEYKYDYKATEGGISDAYEFSANGTNSVNLSVGYRNEHTANEYLVYKDMHIAYEFGLDILRHADEHYNAFGLVPVSNDWIKGYSYTENKWGRYSKSATKGYADDYFDDTYSNYYNAEPFCYEENNTIIISDNFNEIVINKEDIDSIISQLQALQAMEASYQNAIGKEEIKSVVRKITAIK